MRILIVTVYNSANCGSFLQAYSLYRVLETLGGQPVFLERALRHTAAALPNRLRELLAKCLKLRFASACLLWRRYRRYRLAQRVFPTVRETDPAFAGIDCVVLGSDTVWNFASPYFHRKVDTYLGTRFAGRRRVSYAASAANTPYAVFREDPAIGEGLRALDAVSVRDAYTQTIVEELTGRPAPVVCDPTLLTDRAALDALAPPIPERGYILLYLFGRVPPELRRRLTELRRDTGRRLISFGESRLWCDRSVPYDPHTFIAYMRNADFVATNTYHGTLFAILYERNFADYGGRKRKIADLLEACALTGTLASPGDPLADAFRRPPDFAAARSAIAQTRARSLAYLKAALGASAAKPDAQPVRPVPSEQAFDKEEEHETASNT
ncbi:MAG: polysaccharide pyruvyl transferase family protein [Clostridiales bacterium]|nr:polysaccharide pyruvyl transferase family protein [Clostridiales bacterium]